MTRTEGSPCFHCISPRNDDTSATLHIADRLLSIENHLQCRTFSSALIKLSSCSCILKLSWSLVHPGRRCGLDYIEDHAVATLPMSATGLRALVPLSSSNPAHPSSHWREQLQPYYAPLGPPFAYHLEDVFLSTTQLLGLQGPQQALALTLYIQGCVDCTCKQTRQQ